MRILLFSLAAAAIVSCNSKPKEIDPEIIKQGEEMARYRIEQEEAENMRRFLEGTNKNENVSLAIKDSILTVKLISKDNADYSDLLEFYHDLAHRCNISIKGTELRDSLTGKVLARIGYGFKTPFNE